MRNFKSLELARTAVTLMAFMFLGSCTDESELGSDNALGTDIVTFDVSFQGHSLITKTDQENKTATDTLKLELEGYDKPLRIVASEREFPVQNASLTTKGTPVTIANLGSIFGNFVVNAKESVPSESFSFSMSDVDVNYDNGNWRTLHTYYWPKTQRDIDFWFYSPKQLTADLGGTRSTPMIDFLNKKLSLDYEMTYGTENKIDAQKQPDLVFAFKKANQNTKNGHVDVEFKHALSGVKFEAGVIIGCNILNISLNNLHTTGRCVYTPGVATGSEFSWTYGANDIKTVSQAFNTKINKNEDASESKRQKIGTLEQTFMVIPQALNESERPVTATIEYTIGESKNVKTAEVALKDLTNGVWLPGKLYTYIISTDGEKLTISVDDKVEGKTKSELKIMNKLESNVKCYMRAMIIGNWFEKTTEEGEQPSILASWNITDGSFTPALPTAGSPSNNWMLGADGYYYYKYPVYPGDETYDKLFISYTGPTESKIDGSFLKIQIVAQGIAWDEELLQVAQAWPNEQVLGFLSSTDRP